MNLGVLCCLFSLVAGSASAASIVQELNRRTYHLRSGSTSEWQEFEGQTPDGQGITIPFNGRTNTHGTSLLIAQDNVKLDWTVQLNGKKIGALFLMEAPLIHTLAVPPGILRDGTNTLSIIPPKENDDILIGPIQLFDQTSDEILSTATLNIEVVDKESGLGLPCRITVVDDSGRLAPLSGKQNPRLAVRPGVAYTVDGKASLGVLPGTYTVYATRGFEYGLAKATVSVTPGNTSSVKLPIRREVHTPGLACADTHIHTFTYGRHGDATVEERAITLAGEGIELPISTEHDCLVDFSGATFRSGAQGRFTPIIGDEVTTAKGHFNVFPVDFLARLPDNKITNWPDLIRQFRATPGVQVVILNHPRNIHSNFQPFAETNFNAVTGENRRGFDFEFDAIEVANSSALQSDWMISLRDWFALLNYGYHFTGVGSSDCHDVSRYIVGQGRTYLACNDSNPARINIDEACRSLRQGRALVSLGLLADMEVDGEYKVGDLATNLTEQVRVKVTVLGPSWVEVNRVELYSDGIRIRDERVATRTPTPDAGRANGPLNLEITWTLPKPRHDSFLIALATGPGIKEPYWPIARPYQPSSTIWDPHVMGVTNPIWLDADGDGKFTAARVYAQQMVQRFGNDTGAVLHELSDFDQAAAAQVASLWQASGLDLDSASLVAAIQDCPEQVRLGFKAFRGTLNSGAHKP